MQHTDVIIIGGGIVGLATAYQIQQKYPKKRLAILEKELTLAAHQSGRNSGVLHTGIYYQPGSLKASNCRLGKAQMERFCTKEGIPFERCGKVIVALHEGELPALQKIYERGRANGVNCRLISAAELREIEPHAAGIQAIHVPEAGIVDYRRVCGRLAQKLENAGHQIILNTRVTAIEERNDQVIVKTSEGAIGAEYVINCAGLFSDRVTKMTAATTPAQIVPFRGEYYTLTAEAQHLCRGLIYPVPDPKFPFLGVHFTRMISGGVECGPNAVLAFAREGYRFWDVNGRDLWETVRYAGFRRLAAAHFRTGLGEMWRSLSKRAFVDALRRLVPDIKKEHLMPRPAGIRAQAVRPNGRMMDDFALQESVRIVNVVNAPSPAATASLSIGAMVRERLAERF